MFNAQPTGTVISRQLCGTRKPLCGVGRSCTGRSYGHLFYLAAILCGIGVVICGTGWSYDVVQRGIMWYRVLDFEMMKNSRTQKVREFLFHVQSQGSHEIMKCNCT